MKTFIKMGFDPKIAKEVGVEEAIMFANIEFWCAKNAANKKNYFDGNYWTYNTHEAFVELFPFWTLKQIRRILGKLVEKGYLVTGNYNKRKYDQTKWYGIEKRLSIWANGDDQKGDTIPDNKTQIVNSTANAVESETAFDDFELDFSCLEETALEIKSGAGVAERSDKRNPEIEAVYAVFAEECGVRPKPIKGGNGFDLNRGACLRMVRRYGGAEGVCAMARQIFASMKQDKYCKVVTNPLEMENNLGWYKLYFERKGIDPTGEKKGGGLRI